MLNKLRNYIVRLKYCMRKVEDTNLTKDGFKMIGVFPVKSFVSEYNNIGV